MDNGPLLYEDAKTLIPGGTMLLSKRPEMFLPTKWPAYYKKAKGVFVWGLDDTKYIDMSIMGVGACILGYAHDAVNEVVKRAVDDGSMCTLNAPEEVALAKRMLEIEPWAGKVRYARTGGESMAIAVRIARAFTKKQQVAFCGYHGWCDWYLAANIFDTGNLNEHLLTGLDPNGVPNVLSKTALPFRYNDLEGLEKIMRENNVGAIVLEPIRYEKPKENFFEDISRIAKKHGVILIFDEITSGFRVTLGGAYKQYDIQPDIVVYGKAIANGYPMGIVVGTSEVMDAAQTSFISSTFWTERIGPVAALKTIQIIMEQDVPAHLCRIGKMAKNGWENLAKKYELALEVVGLDPLATFHFLYQEKSQMIHTLFTQEMLKRGFLASKQFYVSYAHTEEIVSHYLHAVEETFAVIQKGLRTGTVHQLLEGPIAHSGFTRLN